MFRLRRQQFLCQFIDIVFAAYKKKQTIIVQMEKKV